MATPPPGTLKIFAAHGDDVSEGFVWLAKPELPSRSIVKITNPTGDRSVYCEALQIDTNFLDSYNEKPRLTINDPTSSIVMGGWYRARLGGLATQREYSLDVVAADSWYGRLHACFDHPQIVVRVAAWLGVLSVALGVLGVVLGALSLWPKG